MANKGPNIKKLIDKLEPGHYEEPKPVHSQVSKKVEALHRLGLVDEENILLFVKGGVISVLEGEVLRLSLFGYSDAFIFQQLSDFHIAEETYVSTLRKYAINKMKKSRE